MSITVRRLPSGYLHIRGHGPCNWTQPPSWEPLTERAIREHAFPQASEAFLRAAVKVARRWPNEVAARSL